MLSFQNGHFARRWAEVARRHGLAMDEVQLRWGDPVRAADVEAHLSAEHRALLIVHNETSTGVTTDLAAVRRTVDASGHDPLLLVDTVSSLGSIDFRFDEWRVDVALTGPHAATGRGRALRRRAGTGRGPRPAPRRVTSRTGARF